MKFGICFLSGICNVSSFSLGNWSYFDNLIWMNVDALVTSQEHLIFKFYTIFSILKIGNNCLDFQKYLTFFQ